MTKVDQRILRRVKRRDRVARWVITLGGVVIIASVIAILALILWVTVPLFLPARVELVVDQRYPLPNESEAPLVLGVDRVELEKQLGGDSLTAYAMDRLGSVVFWDISPSAMADRPASASSDSGPMRGPAADSQAADEPRALLELGRGKVEPPGGDGNLTIEAVERASGSLYSLLWSDGSASLVEVDLSPQWDDSGQRSVKQTVRTLATFPPDGGEKPQRVVIRRSPEGDICCVKLLPGNRLAIVRQVQVRSGLFGGTRTELQTETIEEHIPGPIHVVTMDNACRTLYVGTTDGSLALWELNAEGKVRYHEDVPAFADGRKITCVALLHGDVSLIVGDEKGDVTSWFTVRWETPDGTPQRQFRQVHRLSQHSAPIRDILPSRRDKSVVTLDDAGAVHLDHVTAGNHLLTLRGELGRIERIGFATRGNAVIGLDDKGTLDVWSVNCPHPDVSFHTLFGKVHYEGYEAPSYKWQSTGDEPKLSLVPIIFGSIKATTFAMLFAIPLALLGAIYVSHFTTPAFKGAIKPVVEIMAAVPSVVIGFLILLWLAPLMGEYILAAFISLITIPATFFLFLGLWQVVRRNEWAKAVENGYEFLVLVPVMCLGAYLGYLLMDPVQDLFFDGNFKQWLFEVLRQPYEPLNSLVVSFGLGFAIIPIIFSMSEDALSNIPHSLTAASLALGGSRWQTLSRVVLPSASPGIFAAVMVGFGRGVGETMIVFMATGNTPILDWSPFNGFRTLSANIAVEMPEAPVGGTLYRVLFLCAVILFAMTFALNTAAELVRQHLRKRYGRY
ncbi:MAG: ABC transporter permease subunit [Planctomycetota bacterium]